MHQVRWRRWTMGVAVLVAVAGTPSIGQGPTGAAQRPPAGQEPPLMVLSPKAKSPGWSGVHKPHTKLVDVLARHHGQADWAETIVDDESLFAQWISMAPGPPPRAPGPPALACPAIYPMSDCAGVAGTSPLAYTAVCEWM